MKTTLSMISCLTLTVGCATTDDTAGLQRQAVHAQGANFGHLSFDVAANTLRWTEAGAYRQLNLATNQLVVGSSHVDGGPWGLAKLNDRWFEGHNTHCDAASATANCTDAGVATVLDASNDHVISEVRDLYEPSALQAQGDHLVVLAAGVGGDQPCRGVGELGWVLGVGADGARTFRGPTEVLPRYLVPALGGLYYSAGFDPIDAASPCAMPSTYTEQRRVLRRLAGSDVSTVTAAALHNQQVMPLAGNATELVAAVSNDAGTAVLRLDANNRTQPILQLPSSQLVDAAAITPDGYLVAVTDLVAVACTSAADVAPCFARGDSTVLAVGLDGNIGQAWDLGTTQVASMLNIVGRTFVATNRNIIELTSTVDTNQ